MEWAFKGKVMTKQANKCLPGAFADKGTITH